MNDDTNPKDLLGDCKPQLHLVPPALMLHAAKAMENGAKKFGPYNWRAKKVRATVYLSAALRHILALLDGEDTASDSGVHHAGHAAACLGILLDAKETGNLIDDRPAKGCAARLIAEMTTTRESVPPVQSGNCPDCGAPVKEFHKPWCIRLPENIRTRRLVTPQAAPSNCCLMCGAEIGAFHQPWCASQEAKS